jgi:NADPH:quinone reductase-like Zn-dependent oxidoreductase
MRAVELRGVGLESLIVAERPAPVPGPGEVVVEVHAASLNYRDLAIARGEYPAGRPLPLVPGSDIAGTVRALGPGCARARLGARVVVSYVVDWESGEPEPSRMVRRLGGPLDGALAQLVVVPEHALVPIPDELGFAEAATLPVAGVTAWRGLFRVARVKPGDHVLVFGTGGVSIFAIQLASAAGARPIVVVGGDAAKLERVRGLGAWATMDRRTEPAWEDRVLALTGGRGVDVAIDVVGGENTARVAVATRTGGTLLLVGFLGGHELQLDVRALLRRCLRLEALSAGSRDDLQDLSRAIAWSGFRPVIDRVFPLDGVREAFAHLAAGAHLGKVVVEVST